MVMIELDFRSLDLKVLHVFVAVTAERTLTRATQGLSVTQPAVSLRSSA